MVASLIAFGVVEGFVTETQNIKKSSRDYARIA
jgi:hypothetical protein